MTNFAEILKGATLGEIERPKPVPVGSYQALIKSVTFGNTTGEKKTPYARIELELAAPLDDVNQVDLEEFTKKHGAISTKKVKTDFYLTENSLFMLQDFVLTHVGLDMKGMTLDQALPQIVNNTVGVTISHRQDDKKPEVVYAEVKGTFALA